MSRRNCAFLLLTLVLAAGAVFATSCGSSNPVPKVETVIAGASTPGVDAFVHIKDFEFTPATVTITVGGTVKWTNDGPSTHTVTADDGSFDSGDLSQGKTYSHTFQTAGTFAYHCSIHSSMTATVIVTVAGVNSKSLM